MCILYLFFFLLIFSSCKSKNNLLAGEVSLIKYTTNQLIELHENDSTIIVSIDKLIYSNGRFFILDRSGSKIVIYDDKGLIENVINSSPKIIDSAVKYCKPSREGDVLLRYEDISELPEITIDEYIKPSSRILNMIVNNDEIKYTTRVQTFAHTNNPDSVITSNFYIAISPGIVSYNVQSNTEKFYPIIDDEDIITQANNLFYNKSNNKYYIDCYGRRRSGKDWVLAEYDSNFKIDNKLLELPDEYIKSGVGYFLQFAPYLAICKEKTLVAFPFYEKLIDLESRETIDIPSLDYKNTSIFELVEKKKLKRDSILFYLYNTILGIYSTNNESIIAIIRKYYSDSTNVRNSSYTILELNDKGEMLKRLDFPFNNKNGSARHITFSRERNALFVCRKSKKGWIIEEVLLE